MTANAEIILEEHKAVLQIPEGSIIYDKDKKASVEVPDPRARKARRNLPSTLESRMAPRLSFWAS